MAVKADIQATRSDAAASGTAIIEQPIRLKGIIIASDVKLPPPDIYYPGLVVVNCGALYLSVNNV